ncbi:kynurenine 3-monooxygenase [Leptodontidium sp. 2 PMI_412]|nr:kynurenine 3-monooxygenase [Leptodontidium sp. 2 PMI_412]
MPDGALDNIVIIGAGPGGLVLSLALHSLGIKSKIFEQRSRATNVGGAVILAPNALRVLHAFGVYNRLRAHGFSFDSVAFVNDQHEVLNDFEFGGSSKYGFSALRISRQVLVSELIAAVESRGNTVNFDMAFLHVVQESEAEVIFECKDGSINTASLLVGADGIHSGVRRWITPDINPVYSGQLAIGCLISKKEISLPVPKDYDLPAIMYSHSGAFLFIPQDFAGDQVLVGTQRTFPEQDRDGWRRVASAKHEIMGMLESSLREWPEMVQSSVSAMATENLTIWPYYSLPILENWISESARILILGDAAHAIPPTGGQGTCMAIEDAYSLALALFKRSDLTLDCALQKWQIKRQKRLVNVMDMTRQLGTLRLSAKERAEIVEKDTRPSESVGLSDLEWLYCLNLDREDVI